MTFRTGIGVNGETIVLGAWCPKCRQESMPFERTNACGFCDTVLLDECGLPRFLKPGRKPKPPSGNPHIGSGEPSRNGYASGCRCDKCRVAQSAYFAERRRKAAA